MGALSSSIAPYPPACHAVFALCCHVQAKGRPSSMDTGRQLLLCQGCVRIHVRKRLDVQGF